MCMALIPCQRVVAGRAGFWGLLGTFEMQGAIIGKRGKSS